MNQIYAELGKTGAAPPPLRRNPAHMAIARVIGISIVTGAQPEKSILPSELELAAHYNVSRSVIRESLRMLSAKGLIDSRPKAGTRVRERADWNLLDPALLGWAFEGEPSRRFVQNLFQLRLIVEPAAAEIAARCRTDEQLSRMDQALSEMAHHGLTTEQGQAADQHFHATLLEATDNELLINLSASIGAAVRWTTVFKYRGNRPPVDPVPQHRTLLTAIADADAAAARIAAVALVTQAAADTEAALGATSA